MPMDSYRAFMAGFLQRWKISSNYPVGGKKTKTNNNQINFSLNQVLFSPRQATRTTFPSHNNSHFWCFTRSLILANSECVIFLIHCVIKRIQKAPLIPKTSTPPFRRPHRCSNYVLYRSFKIPFHSEPPFMWLGPSTSNSEYFHFLSPSFFSPPAWDLM